jgi:hypothetical protein
LSLPHHLIVVPGECRFSRGVRGNNNGNRAGLDEFCRCLSHSVGAVELTRPTGHATVARCGTRQTGRQDRGYGPAAHHRCVHRRIRLDEHDRGVDDRIHGRDHGGVNEELHWRIAHHDCAGVGLAIAAHRHPLIEGAGFAGGFETGFAHPIGEPARCAQFVERAAFAATEFVAAECVHVAFEVGLLDGGHLRGIGGTGACRVVFCRSGGQARGRRDGSGGDQTGRDRQQGERAA